MAGQLQLTPSHESVLLGSSGLWDLLDKDDAALHSHFHLQARARHGCAPAAPCSQSSRAARTPAGPSARLVGPHT